MLFNKNIGLTAVSTLLSLAGIARADDCLDAPRVPGTFIGVGFSDAKKNLYNCDTKWKDGLVVTGMEVWASEWQVKGIRLTYSDGTQSPIRGQTDNLNNWGSAVSGKPGPPPDNGYGRDKIEWGAGRITKVRQWVNWNGGKGPDAVGRLQIWPEGAESDQKKILDVGSNVGGDGGGMLVDNLGSGVLIGMRTQSGGFLDSLELIFMDGEVKSAEIIHIDWPESISDLNKKTDNIKVENVGDGWIRNSNPIGGQKQGWTLGSGQSRTQTRTITQQTTQIVGADVSISVSAEVDFPLIVKVTSSITASAHWESQKMSSTSTTDTVTYPMTITSMSAGDASLLEPQHAIHCVVSTFSSNYDTAYTAVVRTTMSNGKTFDIRQRGKYVSVLYTDASQDCKTVKLEDVPAGANVSEGTNVGGPNAGTIIPAKTTVLKRAVAFQG